VPYFTAYRALVQRAQPVEGERILIHGASGGVGIATVQLAVAAGLDVTGTAGSEAGSELVAGQGDVRVLDHRDPSHLDAAVELTGGHGFDIIIEFRASVNLGGDLKVLGQRGRVVVVGSRGTVEVDARDLMNAEGTVLGMRGPNARPDEVQAARAAVDAGLRSGALRPVVGRELPLAEAARAHRLLMERPALGRLVLVP
jgi:NADPH2:quinone reductase